MEAKADIVESFTFVSGENKVKLVGQKPKQISI